MTKTLKTLPRNFPKPGQRKRFALATVGDLRALVKMLDAGGAADATWFHTDETDMVEVENFGKHTVVRVVRDERPRPTHGW